VQNPDQIGNDTVTLVGLIGAPAGSNLTYGANGRISLVIPRLAKETTFQVAIWSGLAKDQPKANDLLHSEGMPDLTAMTKGGQALWGAPLETAGKLSTSEDAYVADEIALPDENPFNSWLRPGGHDFFPTAAWLW
jgi:hypothetical protein